MYVGLLYGCIYKQPCTNVVLCHLVLWCLPNAVSMHVMLVFNRGSRPDSTHQRFRGKSASQTRGTVSSSPLFYTIKDSPQPHCSSEKAGTSALGT